MPFKYFQKGSSNLSEINETTVMNRYPESQISNYDFNTNQPASNISINDYNEKLITPLDYVKNVTKSPVKRSKDYFISLFPILQWGPYYPFNPSWFISDFITGVTVATVLVPQAMSYATLATLPPEYGLYSSFMGMICYTFFGTSKDVSVGPVAVMSMEVAKIISRVQEHVGDQYSGPEIATCVALVCGGISLGIGLLRLGFIVELIPLPAVMAFTTGSAFSIICGQLPGLMGFNNLVNTRQASYEVIIEFLKHLPDTTVDAAFGLVSLFILYSWKFLGNWLMKKYPNRSTAITYFLNLRNSVVIIFATLISFLIIRAAPGGLSDKSNFKDFKIVGQINEGLDHVAVFKPAEGLISAIASELPVATIVLVLEHISIAKSFGRVHDYKINPNQEFIAIGVANMVGSFFNAYPTTGSFSRTALSAKCGVKTPFASTIAGCCVLIAIFCFTSAFYYIPKASLCAIIIHCVSDLLSSYQLTWRLYLASPIDCIIFIVGVFIAVFSSIENGIYWAMASSAALILWRMCWANGSFMGRIKVLELINPKISDSNKVEENNISIDEDNNNTTEKAFYNSGLISVPDSQFSGKISKDEYTRELSKPTYSYQYKWVPIPNKKFNFNTLGSLDEPINESIIHTRYINNNIQLESPPPGVIVYRMGESFVYPNCSLQTDRIIDMVKRTSRSSKSGRAVLWNETDKLEFKWQGVSSNNKKLNKLKFWPSKNNKKNDNDDEGDLEIGNSSSMDDENNEKLSISEEEEDNLKKPILKLLHLDFSQVVGIDATSIQALIDLKRTIELYSGSNFEIHFSGIINPWVVRALYNSGFSTSYEKVEDHELAVDIEEARVEHEQDIENNISPLNKLTNQYMSVGFGEDGSLYPLNGTNFPNIHFDIPSYSEFE